MKDVDAIDNKVHIKMDSDHVHTNQWFRFMMLEKAIQSNYTNAKITSSINEYGLLTDVWIEFADISDVTHFKLSWQSKQE